MKTVEELREEIKGIIQASRKYDYMAIPSLDDQIVSNILSVEPIFSLIKILDQTKDVCPECGGKGIKSYSGRTSDGFDKCLACNGTGKREWHPERLARE